MMDLKNTHERRVKFLAVSWDLVRWILRENNFIPPTRVAADSIPQDANLIDVHFDKAPLSIVWLELESEQFDLVPTGSEIPILNTKFERAV